MITGPQWQARMDAEGQTIERGRDACTPYHKHGDIWFRFFMGYFAILAGAMLFIGLGGLS